MSGGCCRLLSLSVSVWRTYFGGASFSSRYSSILLTSVRTSPWKVRKGGCVPGARLWRSAGFLIRNRKDYLNIKAANISFYLLSASANYPKVLNAKENSVAVQLTIGSPGVFVLLLTPGSGFVLPFVLFVSLSQVCILEFTVCLPSGPISRCCMLACLACWKMSSWRLNFLLHCSNKVLKRTRLKKLFFTLIHLIYD